MANFKGDNGPHVVVAKPTSAEDTKPVVLEPQDPTTSSNQAEPLTASSATAGD